MSIEDRAADDLARWIDRCATYKGQVKVLAAEIARLRAEVEDQRQVLKTQVDAWGNQVKQLGDNNNKLKKRIAELEAENARLRNV